tara:strand:+ start:241 stop:378 length:138 start_codon:yes stop_codon:yes gene_type:complete
MLGLHDGDDMFSVSKKYSLVFVKKKMKSIRLNKRKKFDPKKVRKM